MIQSDLKSKSKSNQLQPFLLVSDYAVIFSSKKLKPINSSRFSILKYVGPRRCLGQEHLLYISRCFCVLFIFVDYGFYVLTVFLGVSMACLKLHNLLVGQCGMPNIFPAHTNFQIQNDFKNS